MRRRLALLAMCVVACGSRTAVIVDAPDGHRVGRDAGAPTTPGDAGRPDAGSPIAPSDAGHSDAGARPSCSTSYLCRHTPRVTGTSALRLESGVIGANVAIGSIASLGEHAVVGWGTRTCCAAYGDPLAAAGLARIGPTSTDSHLAFSAAPTGPGGGACPPLLLRDGAGLMLVDTRTPDYAQARHMDSGGGLHAARPPPISGELPLRCPVSLAGDDASAVLELSPSVRVRLLGGDLMERWSVELASTPGFFGDLVATCDGYVALWTESPATLSERFMFAEVSSDGRFRMAREVTFDRQAAMWDGRAVVVVGGDSVLELSSAGDVLDETPLTFRARLAFGTERGLVALAAELDLSALVLVERRTGRLLETLAPIEFPMSFFADQAKVHIEDGMGWLAVTSFTRRDWITTLGLTCD